jgi:hypothetical protein
LAQLLPYSLANDKTGVRYATQSNLEDVMKSANLEVTAVNLVAGMKARLGRAIYVAMATLCLTFSITSTPAFAQQAEESSAFSPASTTTMCGEDLTQLSASGALSVNLASGAEPGATDPMAVPAGRYSLFPDDEVLAFQPQSSLVRALEMTTDRGGTSLDPVPYSISPWNPDGWGPGEIYPAAARFLKPASDDALWAARRGDPNAVDGRADITFFGGTDHYFYRTFSAILPNYLLPRQYEFNDFIAIAAGDLDGVVGTDGNYHDEAVVAKVFSQNSNDYNYDVEVVNYSSGQIPDPDITSASFSTSRPKLQTDPNKNKTGLLALNDNIVSVVTGDFQGTGEKEIGVLALANGTLELRAFRYQTTGSTHQLTQIGTASFDLLNSYPSRDSFWRRQPIAGTLSATAGDFDGDGKDEIAVAYAKWNYDASTPYEIGMLILKFDASFKATVKDDTTVAASDRFGTGTFENRPAVDIVSGQFLLNANIPYGRKQIVVGWRGLVESSANVHFQAYSTSKETNTITRIGNTYDYPGKAAFVKFSIAAGGFEGASAPGNLPIDQLALSYWYGGNTGATVSVLNTYRVTENGISLWQQSKANGSVTGVSAHGKMRVPVIAYDGHGNSRYLGTPVYLSANYYPTLDYVMQEPPKHAYWDEQQHQIVNLTRFDGNNVHLSNGQTATFKTDTTSETSRDTGGSAAVSAGATVRTGSDFGILKAQSEVNTDVTVKSSYDYKEHKESYDSQYEERKLESSGQTDRDDYLKGQLQRFDIWRYRVYGTPTSQNSNGFYEIVLPGPVVGYDGGGMGFDWYQPIQENGNILSYPQQLGPSRATPYIPEDMGTFTLPGNDRKYSEPLVPPVEKKFDGTSGSTALSFNNQIIQGSSFSFSHSIGESLEVRTSITGEGKSPLGGAQLRACGSFEFHNSNSWGGNKSATSTTTDQTSVQLNRTRGSLSTAYPFDTVVYNSKEGALKVAFALPNPALRSTNSGGYEFYAGLYGTVQDPALNLPGRFEPLSAGSGELEKWEPQLQPKRKQMRGLFFRHSTVDPVANTYLLWAGNPKPGDTVRIEPRIYNYSTGTAATNIGIEFQVIRYDSLGNNEICDAPINAAVWKTGGLVCPRSARTTIGMATVRLLNPLQFTCVSGYDDPATTGCAPSAYVDWTVPANLAPDLGTYQYRVYVVLVASGSEKYGLEPNPIRIESVENSTPMVVTAPNSNLETGDYAIIGGVQGLDRANGTYIITRISNNQFALNGTVQTGGSYTGGGSVAKLDPGQNDEGYGEIDVTRVSALTATDDPVPHDYLNAQSLQAPTGEGSTQGQESGTTAVQGVPVDLRFTAYSSIVHADSAQVLLFDGDPAEGNPAIGDQIIHPGANGPEGTSIWMTWTPTTTGQHHLYAALIESSSQAPAGELDVNVIRAQPAIAAQGGEPAN